MRRSNALLIALSCLLLDPAIAAESQQPPNALPLPVDRGGVESTPTPAPPEAAAPDQMLDDALRRLCAVPGEDLAQEELTLEELVDCAIKSAKGLEGSWWARATSGMMSEAAWDRMCDDSHVACDLRALVGRLKHDKKAQVGALRTRARQADRMLAMIERQVRDSRASQRELDRARYESHMAAADLAGAEGNRDAEIAALEQAVADAKSLCAAWKALGDRGIRIRPGVVEEPPLCGALACRYEAESRWIELTIADADAAAEARILAAQKHLDALQYEFQVARAQFEIGSGAFWDFAFARYRRDMAAALVARARGDKTAEVAALEQAIAAAEQLRKGMRAMEEAGHGMGGRGTGPPAPAAKCRCDARLALIAATMGDTAEAVKARREARQRYADRLHHVVRVYYHVGMVGQVDMLGTACRYLLVRLQIEEDKR